MNLNLSIDIAPSWDLEGTFKLFFRINPDQGQLLIEDLNPLFLSHHLQAEMERNMAEVVSMLCCLEDHKVTMKTASGERKTRVFV